MCLLTLLNLILPPSYFAFIVPGIKHRDLHLLGQSPIMKLYPGNG